MSVMRVRFIDYTGEFQDEPHEEIQTITLDPETSRILEAARDEWARLKEEGTPYWCVHEGRGVDHPRTEWKDDTPDAEIHRKHGVMCLDCGGYVQEG